jgi:hypothetical protein
MCGNTLTMLGATTVANESTNSTTDSFHTISSTAVTSLLAEAQLAIEPTRPFVIQEVHDKRGRKPHHEYLVQWAGFPARGEWTWESASKVEGTSSLKRFQAKRA